MLLLRELDASGLEDAEICARASIVTQTLRNWRSGYTANPFHRTMSRVAKVVGLSWKLVRRND